MSVSHISTYHMYIYIYNHTHCNILRDLMCSCVHPDIDPEVNRIREVETCSHLTEGSLATPRRLYT